jgi:hypothetical protein
MLTSELIRQMPARRIPNQAVVDAVASLKYGCVGTSKDFVELNPSFDILKRWVRQELKLNPQRLGKHGERIKAVETLITVFESDDTDEAKG